MSTELINRITVKKDGVYISSHSSNDTAPFHSWRCKGLSEIYAAEGQKGLDREIVCMLYEYAQLRGSHKSLDRYRYAIDSLQAQKIYKKYSDMIDERYESLDEADKKTVWYKPTEKAKEYRAYESEMRKKMYCEIAERCEEYDKKQKSRDLERQGGVRKYGCEVSANYRTVSAYRCCGFKESAGVAELFVLCLPKL